MQAGAVQTDVQHIDDILDDLAEGQRDDREIVALEAQHRHADDHARNRSADAADDDRKREPQRLKGYCIGQRRGGHNAGKCAHRHEARMAERQLAQDADRQVERNREDDIGADRHEQALHQTGDRARREHGLHDNKGDDHDAEGQQRVPSRFGSGILFQFLHGVRPLKPFR